MKPGLDINWKWRHGTVSIPVFTLLIILVTLGWPSSGMAQVQIGYTIPELTLSDHTNQEVSLQSFKGKILLIDFWASWCAPCRKANQKLVKLYKEYPKDFFEIIGISLDTDRKKWLKAVEKDKISYIQLTDPRGFNARSAEIFGVEALPASFLFDKQGMLLAINPTESEIRSYLIQNKN
jgi:thiol-disulfide isomerase/thioredoxin